MLTVLSLGAGVQSTTLALMATHGEITPMPDCAIFADTGWEPRGVYEHLAWLRSPNVLPFPVHIASAGRSLREDVRFAAVHHRFAAVHHRSAAVPFYVKNTIKVRGATGTEIGEYTEAGMGRRQCTREFKVDVIAKFERKLLGYRPRQRIPAGTVECWIGISKDEADREKPARYAWQRNRHPLLELRMDRNDCLKWLERNGYPRPPKSACIACPYRGNEGWRAMRDQDPESWKEAVETDALLRSGGPMKGMRHFQYVHEQLVPLDCADLSVPDTRDLFGNECEGMCGV